MSTLGRLASGAPKTGDPVGDAIAAVDFAKRAARAVIHASHGSVLVAELDKLRGELARCREKHRRDLLELKGSVDDAIRLT